MKYANLDEHVFALRLEPGDDVHESIQSFCSQNSINNAAVEGLGSVESPTLAHYTMADKKFTDKHLDGIFEVTSLLGNVALVEGEPFAHLHVTISGPDMVARAGHLVKGACSATIELIITAYPSHHWKNDDETIGLKVWDFQH